MTITRLGATLLFVGASGFASAQDSPTPEPAAAPQEPEARPTGLPPGLKWTFNFDAGVGSFSFFNSLFTNPRDEPSGNLSDNWLEGYVKPALSASYGLQNGSAIVGTASAVGERTYGSAPTLVGEDFSSFAPDDLSIAWRSGSALDIGENAIELIVGRAQYQLGHGFLLYDGAGEGGSRGGYWSNARKAFEFASIARFKPGPHTADVFYLDKDELPEAETGSRLWGTNYEYQVNDASTFGVTYMRWFANDDLDPGRNGLSVFNARAYTAPIPNVPALAFEVEYAYENNGEALTSTAWSVQGAYEFGDVRWTPKVSYRYAFFEGDDPATATNEAFDPLFLGFSDWGTWWQGEIAGEYFLANSNVVSHQVRLHATPAERLGGGLIFYRFLADQPASYGAGTTSRDIAFELDAYADWKLNQNFTISFVGGFADPGDAVRQTSGRTANFGLGMLYFAYTF